MQGKRLVMGVLVALGLAVFMQAQQPKQAVPEGVKVERDLEYVKDGHERNKLDLYLPEKSDGALPLIVWIHGGSWKGGSKDRCPGVPLVVKGYAVASVNYRLSQHEKFPAQIEDCKTAIRWLRANSKKYNLDPDRFGAWGASAGGHLVALLGTAGDAKELEGKGGNLDQSSKVQAVCDWFGPTDFVRLNGPSTSPSNALAQLIGGPILENKEKAVKASPVTYVSKDAPPFLIMHGDKDPLVPLSQSELFTEALKKAGVEVTLRTLPGAGHGGPDFRSEESRQTVEEFFNKHLKPGK